MHPLKSPFDRGVTVLEGWGYFKSFSFRSSPQLLQCELQTRTLAVLRVTNGSLLGACKPEEHCVRTSMYSWYTE